MVSTKTIMRFMCTECGQDFKDEEEWKYHYIDAHLPMPVIREEEIIVCDVCGEPWEHRYEAHACEQTHKDGTDYAYQRIVNYEKRRKFIEAGMHEDQIKLKED